MLDAAGVEPNGDGGLIALDGDGTIGSFVQRCRDVRVWAREELVDRT